MEIYFVPHVGFKKYAEMTGETIHVVRTLDRNGHLPIIKMGKRKFVDLTKFVDFSALKIK